MNNKNPATVASQMILSLQQASIKMDIDRTIGTVASLSLTLGLYRFVSAMVKGKLNESRAWTFVRVLLGAALTRRLQEFSSLKGARNAHDAHGKGCIGTNDADSNYFVLDGSCHCNSVCFTVSVHLHHHHHHHIYIRFNLRMKQQKRNSSTHKLFQL